MQPIWKLFGNGSVGGQALLGIPRLSALRNDEVLEPVFRVWPFETGFERCPVGQTATTESYMWRFTRRC
jgi:hypothetical protein